MSSNPQELSSSSSSIMMDLSVDTSAKTIQDKEEKHTPDALAQALAQVKALTQALTKAEASRPPKPTPDAAWVEFWAPNRRNQKKEKTQKKKGIKTAFVVLQCDRDDKGKARADLVGGRRFATEESAMRFAIEHMVKRVTSEVLVGKKHSNLRKHLRQEAKIVRDMDEEEETEQINPKKTLTSLNAATSAIAPGSWLRCTIKEC